MHKINMFDRTGVTTVVLKTQVLIGQNNSKKYIGEENVIDYPHKIYGPESNDLALQLRKHGFNNVILAGMSANLCTESHMRDLVELVLGSQ
jgi:nicotinamidase-related amidase